MNVASPVCGVSAYTQASDRFRRGQILRSREDLVEYRARNCLSLMDCVGLPSRRLTCLRVMPGSTSVMGAR
ncbi:hypothetical protein LZ269_38385 [Streptomyces lomondensis]|nr:hypothetical protein [Streptomyces lomondensis]MCF0083157.1 hypothetical protein [Streptomyces lomondensis]